MFETAACVIYDIQAFQFLNAFQLHIVNNKLFIFSSEVNHSQEVNLSPSFTWLSVFCKCHTSLCMWTNHKLRIQFESAKFTMRGWTYSVCQSKTNPGTLSLLNSLCGTGHRTPISAYFGTLSLTYLFPVP